MEIDKMNVGPWGKTLAYFSLKTSEGLIVKGFKLIDGSNGVFVGPPSKKGKDEKFYDDVYLTKELRSEIRDLANAAYTKGGGEAPVSNDKQASDEPPGEYDDIPF